MNGTTRRRMGIGIAGFVLLGAASVALAGAGGLSTYGAGGIGTPLITEDHGIWAMGLTANGSAIVASQRNTGRVGETGAYILEWRIRRYDPAGALDSAYGSGGVTTLFGDWGQDTPRSVAVDGSDRSLIAGLASVRTGTGGKQTIRQVARLARLNPNGSLDSSFAGTGTVQLAPPGSLWSRAFRVRVQSDGCIVVGGTAAFTGSRKNTTRTYPFLARLLSTGSLDSSFGTGGFSVDSRASENVGDVFGLAIQSTGEIVLAVRRATTPWVLTRWLGGGAVDTSFGVLAPTSDMVFGMEVDRLDRIVATGKRTTGTGQEHTLIVRYLRDGAMDSSFGSGGSSVIGFFDRHHATQSPPLFQSDDRIVVATSLFPDPSQGYFEFAPIRLLDNGSLDTSYGNAGLGARLALGTSYTQVYDAALGAYDRAFFAGRMAMGGSPGFSFVAQYDPN